MYHLVRACKKCLFVSRRRWLTDLLFGNWTIFAASSEPPLLLAVSVHCATRAAIKAARKELKAWSRNNEPDPVFQMDVPAIMPVVKKLCGWDNVERYLEFLLPQNWSKTSHNIFSLVIWTLLTSCDCTRVQWGSFSSHVIIEKFWREPNFINFFITNMIYIIIKNVGAIVLHVSSKLHLR